ncbi:hypothetical protein IFT69_10220 [Pseudomonas putida]|nr:hypothetical protein [Pseudomonas putida]
MTTNKVKPSDLGSVWDGNLDSVVHTHRPGNSQKASLRQIVAAAVAAVPPAEAAAGSGESLATGAVVLLPVDEHEGYLECDGAIRIAADAPELAKLLNSGGTNIVGYDNNSEHRFDVTGGSTLKDAAILNGYTLYASQVTSSNVVLTDSANKVVTSAQITSTAYTRKTRNALYTQTTTFATYIATGLPTNQPAFNATALFTDSNYKGMAAVGDNLDLAFSSQLSSTRLIDTVTGTSVVSAIPTNGQSSVVYSAVGAGKDRVFVLATIGYIRGLFEIVWNGSVEASSVKLLKEMATGSRLLADSGSRCIYFGEQVIQHRYDLDTGLFSVVNLAPNATSTTVVMSAFDDVIWFNDNTSLNTNSMITYDAGKTWQPSPSFNSYIRKVFVNPETSELVTIGNKGTNGSSSGATGSVQYNQLKKLGADQFKTPQISSPAQGYRYYVKK